MKRGKLITIEGIEGAGKSTLISFVNEYLMLYSVDVILTREPGGTEIGEEIRATLLSSAHRVPMHAYTELLLLFAARNEHIQNVVKPALAKGQWVVSDRYSDASFAYQGGGRGVPLRYIKMLDSWIVKHLKPDLTLLLDLPPLVGLQRAEQRRLQKDRIEKEKIDFFEKVREAYLVQAREQPNRIHVIDATQTISTIQNEIKITLDTFLARAKVQ